MLRAAAPTPRYCLPRRLRVDPCGNPADLEAATPSDCPQRDTTCSVLDSEPCRVEIANASQASVQLIWYSYEGAGARPPDRRISGLVTVLPLAPTH